MPAETATAPPSLSLSQVALPIVQAREGAPAVRIRHGFPVVLYSPGYEDDRELGTALVSDLASRGYVVVTVDETYEAPEVGFPNGRLAVSHQPNTQSTIPTAMRTRVADIRFVLDELTRLNAGVNPDADHRPLPAGLAGALDLTHIGMFGHSLGGATTADAMAADPRIIAGIDLDGSIVTDVPPTSRTQAEQLAGAVATQLGKRPFMVMTSNNLGPGGGEATLGGFWTHLTGWRRFLTLSGAQHYSYTDEEAFLSQLAAAHILSPSQVSDFVTPSIGTIQPEPAIAAERAYVGAFFDLHLRHLDDHLLDAPSSRYPEIKFLGR